MNKILFVCLGNICRSPMAEGVFRHYVEEQGVAEIFSIDSAGTAAYHVGKSPDVRSQKTLLNKGLDITAQRARQVQLEDFGHYDYIVAMDSHNYNDLKHLSEIAGSQGLLNQAEVVMMLDYYEGDNNPIDVPDPYYGHGDGFEFCYELIHNASQGLYKAISED